MKKCFSYALPTALLFSAAAVLAQPPMGERPPPTELGSMPAEAQFPTVEFIFEERVTLGPAVVLGDTVKGHRQYIPITGGTVVGPKFNGRVVPGGWDYQQREAESGCLTMTADYFLESDDGVVIRLLNEAFNCNLGAAGDGSRSYFRPRFEAPVGKYSWMSSGTFVASLEGDFGGDDGPAIRIKVYQIK